MLGLSPKPVPRVCLSVGTIVCICASCTGRLGGQDPPTCCTGTLVAQTPTGVPQHREPDPSAPNRDPPTSPASNRPYLATSQAVVQAQLTWFRPSWGAPGRLRPAPLTWDTKGILLGV